MARSHDSQSEGAERFDDLYWESRSELITEGDAVLEDIVAGAELPVLLAAIAAALDDTAFLPAELIPPLTPIDTEPHPHGGMTPEQQKEAAALALVGLKSLRDRKSTP